MLILTLNLFIMPFTCNVELIRELYASLHLSADVTAIVIVAASIASIVMKIGLTLISVVVWASNYRVG